LNASTGSFVLLGGRINGGQVTFSGGATLVLTTNGGILSAVTLNGDLNLAASGSMIQVQDGLVLNGVIHLTGAGAVLTLQATQVVSTTSAGTIAFEETTGGADYVNLSATADATFTIGPGVVISGGRGVIQSNGNGVQTLIVQGIIRGNVPGAGNNLTVQVENLSVPGTLDSRTGGTLSVVLPTTGSPPQPTTFTNSGIISAASGGTVAFTGNLVFGAAGEYRVEISGTTPADIGRVTATGTITLGGTLRVTPAGGWVPDCVNNVIVSGPSVTGQFTQQILPPPPVDHQSLVVYIAGSASFAISPVSDWNHDGVLNVQDFLAYIASFAAGDAVADFNGDGHINLQDFLLFLASYARGCG
jgi:hypothetical protein